MEIVAREMDRNTVNTLICQKLLRRVYFVSQKVFECSLEQSLRQGKSGEFGKRIRESCSWLVLFTRQKKKQTLDLIYEWEDNRSWHIFIYSLRRRRHLLQSLFLSTSFSLRMFRVLLLLDSFLFASSLVFTIRWRVLHEWFFFRGIKDTSGEIPGTELDTNENQMQHQWEKQQMKRGRSWRRSHCGLINILLDLKWWWCMSFLLEMLRFSTLTGDWSEHT